MATSFKNLSSYNPDEVVNAKGMRFCVIVADWNVEITGALLRGCLKTLIKHGAAEDNIHVARVPGTFELTYGAKIVAEELKPDAVIVLGCVIQGETRHFDYICQGVTQGITSLNLEFSLPFVFGVLTTDTMQQAADRAGGKHGNKGDEAAVTAIKMADLKLQLKSPGK